MLWRKYFNVRAVETQSVRFGGRILTDGKAVSIQMKRDTADIFEDAEGFPKDATVNACNEAVTYKGARRVGVDPGMTDIVTIASDNTKKEIRSFSSAKFSEMAGYNTNLEGHVKSYLAALPVLLTHRFDKGYRSMRFLRFMGKQKTIEEVCNTIAPRNEVTVVGFGNWSNQGYGIRLSCSGPIKEIRQRLSRRENVLFKNVDEYKTSCTCHGCFNRLVNMKATSTLWRWRKVTENGVEVNRRVKEVVNNNKVHKVLHCCNSVPSVTSRCGATWNRDVNASKNLLLLLVVWMDEKERPANFCRSLRNTVSEEAAESFNHVHPGVDSHETQMLSFGPTSKVEIQHLEEYSGPS
eukprot:gene3340-biopygen21104